MKKLVFYIAICLSATSVSAQYYLRGEIKDEKNEFLQNVKITLHSDKLLYYSGNTGSFGISSTTAHDSITVSLDGYETKTVSIKSDEFLFIVLKALSSNASKQKTKLISISKDQSQIPSFRMFVNQESYFSLVENEKLDSKKFPTTGFSLNINKASYSNVRRFLNMNSSVPPDAVRVEELLNYFNLNYKEPDKGENFKIESNLSTCPWNEDSRLLYLNINARKIDLDNVPPSNLVFLIDASGSMDMPNRLPLVKAAFQLLVKNLREKDTVSIVIYGGTVAVWMQPTSGAEKQKIIKSIEALTAQGDTPGESAIRTAYKVAESNFIKNGNNRVILATDGDFNIGEVSEKALEDLITREKQSGVYLTCLGVGMGNFKDSKLETLAKRGNGNYAYLDDIREAEKVLVKEITQTFYAVADDAFLNIRFNPELVKNYRLIGFDNKKDAIEDSTGQLEGGEIGSGNSVLAIFEITPVISDRQQQIIPDTSIALIDLRYLTVNKKQPTHFLFNCKNTLVNFKDLNKELQFGTAVAMFGLKLRKSKNIPKSNWDKVESIALSSYNPNDYLQNEFVQLIGEAKKIYSNSKKNRKKKKLEMDDEN